MTVVAFSTLSPNEKLAKRLDGGLQGSERVWLKIKNSLKIIHANREEERWHSINKCRIILWSHGYIAVNPETEETQVI